MNSIAYRLHAIDEALAAVGPGDETLLNGRLGGALYYYYSYMASGSAAQRDQAENILYGAIQDFNAGQRYQDPSYGAGAAGLFWLLAQMQQQGLTDGIGADDWQFLSQKFAAQARQWVGSGRVDNLYGAVGLLHYLEQTSELTDNQPHITALVAALAAEAHWDEYGASFSNDLLHGPTATIDLGLAHGLSGLLLVLLNIHAKGFASPQLVPLIEGLLAFVAGTYTLAATADGQCSRFPVSLTGAGRDALFSNRLAWCYGDLTQAILFQRAGQLLQQPAWLALAQQIASACLPRRSNEQTLVQDAAFCHGAAGLAQLYQTLYQLTGDAAHQAMHQYWLAETLTRLEQELAANHYRHKEWSVLEGLSGIGLVLLSATAAPATSWSNLLFLS